MGARFRHFPALALLAGLSLSGCGGAADEAGDEGSASGDDPGSLCACRELDSGELECCFGHGECREQDAGPRRCACDEGARGETCSTPAPGVWPARQRSCPAPAEGQPEDPGCARVHEQLVVEAFDSCVDLEGEAFESVIVRPAADLSGSWPAPPSAEGFPVAVLVHGASQNPWDYYDLLEQLAANELVVAAFEASAGGDVSFRANRLLSYLQCLRGQWPEAGRLSDRYALVGHSRGGTAIALAAEAITAGLAAPGVEVEALVALAPTRTQQFSVDSSLSAAYLALSGARDPDTQGAALGWFDLASEADPSLLRSLVWVHGASHHRFHQGLLFSDTGEVQASLSSPGHWAFARAYIGGFLQWRLHDRAQYRPLFTGAQVPASVAAHYPNPDVPGIYAGLREGSEAYLRVHAFEGAELSPSALGGEVIDGEFSAVQLGPLAELDPPWSGAHLGNGARLDWEAGSAPSLRIELDPSGEAVDLSPYSALSISIARSFDAAQDCGEAGPLAPLSLHFVGAQATVELPLTALGHGGVVPAADRLVPESFGNWVSESCHAQDALRPLRIPLQLACDAGLDPAQVEAIELHVDGSVAGGLLLGEFALERGADEPPGCP